MNKITFLFLDVDLGTITSSAPSVLRSWISPRYCRKCRITRLPRSNSGDKIAAEWRQQIALEYDQIKAMSTSTQAEQVLLSEDARKKKEEEIMEREKQVRDLQKEKFGPRVPCSGNARTYNPYRERVYGAIGDLCR
ncbi:MAG: hypothetical protein IPP25_16290 [Saprospiraceae bacterium]|nr:hypothetical protein [Candidatus Opimibacter skivensis]